MNSVVKFPVPRNLEDNETAVTLGQWKNQFTIYAQRDSNFSPFLTANWNKDAQYYGFQTAQQGVNCELFIRHVTSFLKTPFWNHKILNRSRNLKDIWKTFNTIFGIEEDADSFLDIGAIKYDGSESPSSFYARIMYHLESHLPTAGTEVDGISAGDQGEKMSILVMDMAAWAWMDKINPGLVDRGKIDFGTQIKQGKRISALVPDIAKHM